MRLRAETSAACSRRAASSGLLVWGSTPRRRAASRSCLSRSAGTIGPSARAGSAKKRSSPLAGGWTGPAAMFAAARPKASERNASSSTRIAGISAMRSASVSTPQASKFPTSERIVKRGLSPSVGTGSSTRKPRPSSSFEGAMSMACSTTGASYWSGSCAGAAPATRHPRASVVASQPHQERTHQESPRRSTTLDFASPHPGPSRERAARCSVHPHHAGRASLAAGRLASRSQSGYPLW